MENNIFRDINTGLDLNGPTLSFTTQPTNATGIGTTVGAIGGESLSFTGMATAFPEGTGHLLYQWYKDDLKLTESTKYVGVASTGPIGSATTLTVNNLVTPSDNGGKYYVTADYIHSAYGVGKSTGNAINEPLSSGIATAIVTPLIEIVAQPTSQQTLINATPDQYLAGQTIFVNVDAGLTDNSFSDDLTYQWLLNGEECTDGVKSDSWTSGSLVPGEVNVTFNSPGTHNLPAVSYESLEATVAGGAGGQGGSDAGGPGGCGGQGRAGKLLVDANLGGATLACWVGSRGNGGSSGGHGAYGTGGQNGSPNGKGGNGGGAGQSGWSGGGGGGGSSSYVSLVSPTRPGENGIMIVSAGGGGGGGGSHNRGGYGACNNNPGVGLGYGQGSNSGPLSINTGNGGSTKNGDGGGGGGGGGGVQGGSGGNDGQDNSHGGHQGSGGSSGTNTNVAQLIGNGWLNDGDGYVNLKYTGYTDATVTTTRKTTISGSTTSTLQLSSDTVGVQTAQCRISSVTGSNSPILTDSVSTVFVSALTDNNVMIEAINLTNEATVSSVNLNNGDFSFNTTNTDPSAEIFTDFYSFYSPDKDINVEMDMYGGKIGNGAEGGYSRIRFTMERNVEYVLYGLSHPIDTPFLYRKSALIACVGAGGHAGKIPSDKGGLGGGVGIAGAAGTGNEGASETANIGAGQLGNDGIFGSAFVSDNVYPGDSQAIDHDGGQAIKCTKGVYWAQQGIAPCADVASDSSVGDLGKLHLADGTIVTNTGSINRGYKVGYNIVQTGGKGYSNVDDLGEQDQHFNTRNGDGGCGAIGGDGAYGPRGGGAGGTGYTDGSVTVVSSTLGGSTGDAKVVLRVAT